eukprot:SAG31_NODE_2841_length_5015_cov_1.524817_5_plen_113_part_00
MDLVEGLVDELEGGKVDAGIGKGAIVALTGKSLDDVPLEHWTDQFLVLETEQGTAGRARIQPTVKSAGFYHNGELVYGSAWFPLGDVLLCHAAPESHVKSEFMSVNDLKVLR